MLRRTLLDLKPLRSSPAFRRLWVSSSVSVLGGQLSALAVLLYVWELTHDPFWVGATSLAHAIPLVVFALAGGSVADAVDRRTLVIWTSTGQLVAAAALAAVVVVGAGRLWLVLALLAVQSTFAAAGAPARRTFAVRLLPPAQLGAGLALTHSAFQASMLVGPALGGVLAGAWGVEVLFALDTLTFVVALYGVWSLPPMPPERVEQRPGLGAVWEGVRMVRRRPVLAGAFLTDLSATLLAMPIALFPAVNAERYGGSEQTLGLFLSAIAVGGISASLLSGSFSRSRRPGRVMLVSVACWGAGLAAFGLTDVLWLGLAALAIAGAADTVSVISRGTMVRLATPDSYRGRVSSMDYIVGVAGPDLGNARAGAVASVASTGAALVSGGLMSVAGAVLVAVLLPAVRRFRVDE